MTVLWVILNEDKTAVVEVFETESADSVCHWPKFFEHRQGTAFCRRETAGVRRILGETSKYTWYANYFYWEDTSRWGYGEPKGMAWSACMAVPEPLKMLEFLE